MTSRQATRTLVPWLAILTIPGLFATQAPAAAPDPVDILSVTSTATALEVVHSPVPDGVRRFILQVEQALQQIREVDERLEAVFDCRYFAGLSEEETAHALDVSVRTVQRDWQRAKGWMREHLSGS